MYNCTDQSVSPIPLSLPSVFYLVIYLPSYPPSDRGNLKAGRQLGGFDSICNSSQAKYVIYFLSLPALYMISQILSGCTGNKSQALYCFTVFQYLT
jgi:hypothetical protein